MTRFAFCLLIPLLAVLGVASRAEETANNPVEALEARLEKGEAKLAYADDGHGYLTGLLAALNISPESQVLPFTRSSLQFDRITPQAPRAV